jgi:hypothetical protein
LVQYQNSKKSDVWSHKDAFSKMLYVRPPDLSPTAFWRHVRKNRRDEITRDLSRWLPFLFWSVKVCTGKTRRDKRACKSKTAVQRV